jgi:hypothetical protein
MLDVLAADGEIHQLPGLDLDTNIRRNPRNHISFRLAPLDRAVYQSFGAEIFNAVHPKWKDQVVGPRLYSGRQEGLRPEAQISRPVFNEIHWRRANKGCDECACRPAIYVLRRSDLADLSLVQDRNTIA